MWECEEDVVLSTSTEQQIFVLVKFFNYSYFFLPVPLPDVPASFDLLVPFELHVAPMLREVAFERPPPLFFPVVLGQPPPFP